ncbi:5-(carboxyamino)imidazole ribonucleotide synthase [Comamonas serinivorans]|uniref:N5-carboxyaminoimidazole ribonucleotide synthase n=1 Tax=Comamonas serinivorans TaxID=1082851 RepID=A0A1Y0ESF5_9BURK|nr:5-(carboxyamino)imidazole ribonucleotide synthase [Comamonas serinivorans]ARU06543.1 5-(carboxyamino)imidazole ribonucleotide synthase [Comamonas serinivorans]
MSTATPTSRLPIRPLLPGQTVDGRPATLGVLGGGQLGRMFVQAAQSLGFDAVVLDPEATSPAGQVSHLTVQGAYDDRQALARLAGIAHAVTTEFENVPADSMAELASRLPVAPQADAVAIAQDRVREKALFKRCEPDSNVGPAPYAVIETAADVDAAPEALFPGVLKTARLGYDGKGQANVATRDELRAAWQQLGGVVCVLEQRLSLQDECSVIIARGADGTVVHLPMQRNLHRGGILAMTEVYEGNVPRSLANHAVQATRHIAQALDYVGVLCVEFFVLSDGRLVVNEMAPRPHNSGHYSVDACDVSQFDLQVRTLAGLPLLQPRLHSPTVMLNLLGDLWFDAAGQPRELPWAQLLALPGCHLHLYGKREARAGRKMGHLTLTAATIEAVRATAREAAALLGMAPWWDDAASAAQVRAATDSVQDE